ncbi:hypothetical protein B0F90DRAFT_1778943 [Multifurca ochricompacta]|uniref:F-box domain-containing protein n=1 Tax=Multifurca ochricompacta TaxID=376703 RepID=A0AAD4QJ58_9AGAM|nr:hypothetical protein B0F90DRAFT_1778943 [Multifurca ochricompacta]
MHTFTLHLPSTDPIHGAPPPLVVTEWFHQTKPTESQLVRSESAKTAPNLLSPPKMNTYIDHVLYPRRARRNSARRNKKSIKTLPDDILLDIFDYYRLAVGIDWPQRWYTLAHVCRRWKQLIFASSLRLALQLRSTFGTQVEDMITYSPPFPLVLDYDSRYDESWSISDVDGVLFALLQHPQRVREIVLSAPASRLARLTMAMTGAAPIVEFLKLESQTTELILPRQFLDGQAPQLRRLVLSGCTLHTLHPLLSSATSLVNLTLHRIPSSAYFSPDSLASCLRCMPRLQSLSITFLSAVPSSANVPLPPPNQTTNRAEVPMLEEFTYRGTSTYLNALLSKLHAPLMKKLHLRLFNQLTLSIPHIAVFTNDTASSLKPTLALIEFYESSVWLTMLDTSPHSSHPHRQRRRRPGAGENEIAISVSCDRLDYQVSSLVSICHALMKTLSPIEELMIGFHARELPRGEHEEQERVDSTLWCSLLMPFQQVHTLRVDAALGAELARALESESTTTALDSNTNIKLDVDKKGAGEQDTERNREENWQEWQQQQQRLLPSLHTITPLYHGTTPVEVSASASVSAVLASLWDKSRMRH